MDVATKGEVWTNKIRIMRGTERGVGWGGGVVVGVGGKTVKSCLCNG